MNRKEHFATQGERDAWHKGCDCVIPIMRADYRAGSGRLSRP
jgi:hypothetical protein